MANYYNLSAGGSQSAATYPVQPVTLSAVATAQTNAVAWDETDMVGTMIQIQYSLGTDGEGTVTTEAGTALVGDGTNFTDFSAGDYLFIADEIAQIASIEGDEALTLVSAFSGVEAGAAWAGSGAWVDLTCVADGIATYDHAGLEASTTYFYRIRTLYRTKWSAWSEAVADTTGA